MMTAASSASPDVVVIGGGPAGSTVSTLLAKHGRRVQLFERETFPRFHIGESLIPENYWVLQRLDMLWTSTIRYGTGVDPHDFAGDQTIINGGFLRGTAARAAGLSSSVKRCYGTTRPLMAEDQSLIWKSRRSAFSRPWGGPLRASSRSVSRGG